MMMIVMMSMVMIISVGVERKGSYKRFSISVNLSSELAGTKDTVTSNKTGQEELVDENHLVCCEPVGVNTNTAQL